MTSSFVIRLMVCQAIQDEFPDFTKYVYVCLYIFWEVDFININIAFLFS